MQFGCLFKKNFILWKRFVLGSVCEILLPLLLIISVFALSFLVEVTPVTLNESLPVIIPSDKKMTMGKGLLLKEYFKDCSLDKLSDMFQSALEDHETGIDVLASNDPRVQTSNCKNLSLWQTGRQQYVATPGPSTTDVPGLSNMHTIKTKI